MNDCFFAIEVWSSGLETWERVMLDHIDEDRGWLEFVHTKVVNDVHYDFFKDELNRWFRCPRKMCKPNLS